MGKTSHRHGRPGRDLAGRAACGSTNKEAGTTVDGDAPGRSDDPCRRRPQRERRTGRVHRHLAGARPAPSLLAAGPGVTRRPRSSRGAARSGWAAASRTTTIKIGVNHAAPLGPAYAAVGFGGSAEGTDERPITEALVKYLNAHGGIAGRKIDPIYYEYDAVTGGTWDSPRPRAACDQFNNDDKVFAVISGHVGQTDSLLDCLAKGKTPLVTQNQWPYDGKYYTDYKNYLYQPGRMRPERWMPQYIAGLEKNGFFTGSGIKLGVLGSTLRSSDVSRRSCRASSRSAP